ncbi:alpha/beta hydrolase family protein [Pedobacter faecalis]|uniref:alpha/beta hydrolase family protein n=1 Tax=Pedobacter faecalis TaxID=3041495 RepID=UPI00254D8C89|nr:prolyl oligopeptidase family serine peptidase [Pedobacter sp. ELA7]
MKIYFIVLFCLSIQVSLGQKRKLDNNSHHDWQKLAGYGISDNGKYIWNYITNDKSGSIFNIVDNNGRILKTIPNAMPFYPESFLGSGNDVAFKVGIDKIGTYGILDGRIRIFKNVKNSALTDDNLILIQNKNDSIILVSTDRVEKYICKANAFWISRNSTIFLQYKDSLIHYDLKTGFRRVVYTGKLSAVKPDPRTAGVAFVGEHTGVKAIFFYDRGLPSAKMLCDEKDPSLDGKYKFIDNEFQFSPDGSYLFFTVAAESKPAYYRQIISADSDITTSSVNIWSYKYEFIKYSQPKYEKFDDKFVAAISTHGGKQLQIVNEDGFEQRGVIGDDCVLLRKATNWTEAYYDVRKTPVYKLYNYRTGILKEFVPNVPELRSAVWEISPTGKFVIGTDTTRRDFYTYDIARDKLANTTKNIDLNSDVCQVVGISKRYRFYDRIFWTKNDKYFLIYDKFDIWQIDPEGKSEPINLTNGYGRKVGLKFLLANFGTNSVTYVDGSEIVMSCTNLKNMYNGLSTTQLSKRKDPEIHFCDNNLYAEDIVNFPVLKARKRDIYIFTKQSASTSPNLLISKGLGIPRIITSICPEQKYNWLSSELITYTMNNGETNKAIVYKPEVFDPDKTYPIIFHYYQTRHQELNLFKPPLLSEGDLQIPWYVSNGYIVVVPDILNERLGDIKLGTLRSVLGAVDYLKTNKWFDINNMGLQGHSFGGYETNLIVANSDIFKAAQASAGVSDVISHFGSLAFGLSAQNTYNERGQANFGASLWDWQSMYMANSPVLQANRIVTPLLLMHNKGDDNVPFPQAIEMFTALRRLMKPVWLLEYEGEGHILTSEKNNLDFTIRQQQFFDHYLKGSEAPGWMTQDLPSKYKPISLVSQ